MYVNPFWAGVLVTLVAVMVTFVVASIIYGRRKK